MKTIQSVLPVLPVLLSLVSSNVHSAPTTAEKPKAEKPRLIIGRFERVVLRDVPVQLKARIDTGAAVSSIHAKIIEIKQTPNGERVVFEIKDERGVSKTLERDIVEWASIKVMGTNSRNRRPVVIMRICLGGKKLKGRVNLTDRSNFLYPVLIGRNLINTGKFLIDASQKYLIEPDCD